MVCENLINFYKIKHLLNYSKKISPKILPKTFYEVIESFNELFARTQFEYKLKNLIIDKFPFFK